MASEDFVPSDGSLGRRTDTDSTDASATDFMNGDPGPEFARMLAAIDPRLATGLEILNAIKGFDRLISWASAKQNSLMAAAVEPGTAVSREDAIGMAEAREKVDIDLLLEAEPEMAEELIAEQTLYLAAQELAPLLNLVTVTASQRLSKARDLVTNLPMIHDAMLSGSLNPYRASLIAKGTITMAPATRELAGQILLNQGKKLCNSRLRMLIDRTVRDLDKEASDKLGKKAYRERAFGLKPEDYGMAKIWAVLPADQAVLIKGIVEEIAAHNFKLQRNDPNIAFGTEMWRSRTQMCADAFADIITTLATAGVVDLRPLLKDDFAGAAPQEEVLDATEAETMAVEGTDVALTAADTYEAEGAVATPSTTDSAKDDAAGARTDTPDADPASDSASATEDTVREDSAPEDTAPEGSAAPAHTAAPAYTATNGSAATNDSAAATEDTAPEDSAAPAHTATTDSAAATGDTHHLGEPSGIMLELLTVRKPSQTGSGTIDVEPNSIIPFDDCVSQNPAPTEVDLMGGPTDLSPTVQPPLHHPLIKPTSLNLTMSVETLLQLRNDPGYLEGFSFIPDYLRDAILKSAASVTVLVLDDCGTLLDLGKTARFPSKALGRFIQTRDRICRCPGCNNPARKSDLDHQHPWKQPPGEVLSGTPRSERSTTNRCDTGCSNKHAAGETCAGNLAALSRGSHLMKHHTQWEVEHCADHSMVWTTPNGHKHTTYPHDWRLALPTSWVATAQAELAARQAAKQKVRDAQEAFANLPDEPPF